MLSYILLTVDMNSHSAVSRQPSQIWCVPMVLTKRGKAFTINEVEKPLRWTAWFLLSLLPLLHRCLANAKNGRKHSLTNMVSRSNAPDVLRLK